MEQHKTNLGLLSLKSWSCVHVLLHKNTNQVLLLLLQQSLQVTITELLQDLDLDWIKYSLQVTITELCNYGEVDLDPIKFCSVKMWGPSHLTFLTWSTKNLPRIQRYSCNVLNFRFHDTAYRQAGQCRAVPGELLHVATHHKEATRRPRASKCCAAVKHYQACVFVWARSAGHAKPA